MNFWERFKNARILVWGSAYEDFEYSRWIQRDPYYIGIGYELGQQVLTLDENPFNKNWQEIDFMAFVKEFVNICKTLNKKFAEIWFDRGVYQHIPIPIAVLNSFHEYLIPSGYLYIPKMHLMTYQESMARLAENKKFPEWKYFSVLDKERFEFQAETGGQFDYVNEILARWKFQKVPWEVYAPWDPDHDIPYYFWRLE